MCPPIHHVPKCISCHKVIVVITGRAHSFHDYMYVMPILLLWDLSTLLCVLWITYDHLYIYIYIYIYIFIIYLLVVAKTVAENICVLIFFIIQWVLKCFNCMLLHLNTPCLLLEGIWNKFLLKTFMHRKTFM